MPFVIDPPEYVDEDLCSVAIEAPTQLRKREEFGLLVAAWFGRQTLALETQKGKASVTFGITSCKLTVETCKRSRVPISPSFEKIAHRIRFTLSKNEENAKGGEAGAAVSLSLPFKLPFLEAKAKAGGDWKKAISVKEVGESEYEKEYLRVWRAGTSHWRIAAIDPTPDDPVLTGNELGEVPLCAIETPDEIADVTVSIRVPFMDLWMEAKPGKAARSDPETDSNRSAVCRALFAKRLKQRGKNADPDDPQSEVILARARLRRSPDGTPS